MPEFKWPGKLFANALTRPIEGGTVGFDATGVSF